jgi:hypothetical protein
MTAERASGTDDTVPEALEELRALADALLDRVEPWLRAGAEPVEGPAGDASCGWCPLCALAATLRGERPELSRRLAEQGVGWLSAVRALLDAHDESCATTPPGPEEPVSASRVQRIPVRDSGLPR